MPSIRQLPPSVVNKIAAGEVIERPASIVKELMENAVDAGARRIDVVAEQGGLELVRVTDDGSGIAAEQLPLAVASHATSKIRDADDLFRVRTLGFRGEALASIAEVSRLVLRSRTSEEAAGAQLEIAGGTSQGISPCGCAVGTTVEVRQLFYNTPVRRKFLRSTQTEMGHLGEAFIRVALAYPHVHCTLSHNGRSLYDLPAAGDLRDRVGAFFGHDLAADLIAVASQEDDVRLAGFVASPSHSRANARLQYLFLNGRAIRDRALQHALGEAYRGLLLTGRYPIAFLNIEMPPEAVDVNVHPTKLEVRFQESGRLYSQLLGTLRTKFLSTDLTARLTAPDEGEAIAGVDPARA
jgi:DNA mismatch repair protein MutL